TEVSKRQTVLQIDVQTIRQSGQVQSRKSPGRHIESVETAQSIHNDDRLADGRDCAGPFRDGKVVGQPLAVDHQRKQRAVHAPREIRRRIIALGAHAPHFRDIFYRMFEKCTNGVYAKASLELDSRAESNDSYDTQAAENERAFRETTHLGLRI